MNTSLQILLCIAVIILVAKLAGASTARLGLPLVLGELLAGVFLGPTVFNIWSLPWLAQPATAESVSVIAVFKVLAEIGVVLLMFVAGLETDVAMMRSAVAPAFWAATGGVILPMLGGTALARQFGFSWSGSYLYWNDSYRHKCHDYGTDIDESETTPIQGRFNDPGRSGDR